MSEEQTSILAPEDFASAIVNGGYDNDLNMIQDALDQRREVIKEDLRKKVREVFGEDAEITVPDQGTLAQLFEKTREEEKEKSTAKNPFVQKSLRGDLADKSLPGPYRIDPRDGNAYRLDKENEDNKSVIITDPFGGHVSAIMKENWLSWELMPEKDDEITEALPEPARPQPPIVDQLNQGESAPIEQRGAIIGGITSGDIGE